MRTLCATFAISMLLLTFNAQAESGLDVTQIGHVASNSPSLLLNTADKIKAADTFVQLVKIKGISGNEQAIRAEVKSLLTSIGAKDVLGTSNSSNAPLNLLMEIPASSSLVKEPGILLNAHLDTIAQSTPELMQFDAGTGDFFHQFDSERGKTSSFGGDDRSGVAVIVEAIRKLKTDYWDKGVAHRRIVLLFTADEERGCIGAKYLARNEPDTFKNLDISLSMDGPLDYQTEGEPIVTVVSKADAKKNPYKRVLDMTKDFCARRQLRRLQTEEGLGYGDFAHFPESAHSGLHIRSPVRGWHNHERVNVRDLINHIDLVSFIVLGWDHPLPEKISPETIRAATKASAK